MTEFVKYPNAPIASDGWWIIFISLGVTLGLALLSFGSIVRLSSSWGSKILFVFTLLGFCFTLFSFWFFRNPERQPAQVDPRIVISAADGTVLKVERVADSRYGQASLKMSIFMSPFNVHVNRVPVTGVVEKVEYVPGKFFAANLDKASTDNERNLVIVKTEDGNRVGFLQIAGFIARRIVCHLRPGDRVQKGQRYGMIRFGSRMEIFLPEGSQILVKPGEKVRAGETAVGVLPHA